MGEFAALPEDTAVELRPVAPVSECIAFRSGQVVSLTCRIWFDFIEMMPDRTEFPWAWILAHQESVGDFLSETYGLQLTAEGTASTRAVDFVALTDINGDAGEATQEAAEAFARLHHAAKAGELAAAYDQWFDDNDVQF